MLFFIFHLDAQRQQLVHGIVLVFMLSNTKSYDWYAELQQKSKNRYKSVLMNTTKSSSHEKATVFCDSGEETQLQKLLFIPQGCCYKRWNWFIDT